MERTLIDILVDEKEAINELDELNRRIEKARETLEKVERLFENGMVSEEEYKKNIHRVNVMVGMRVDYFDILSDIHKEIIDCVSKGRDIHGSTNEIQN